MQVEKIRNEISKRAKSRNQILQKEFRCSIGIPGSRAEIAQTSSLACLRQRNLSRARQFWLF
ncbi:hypothetical protein FJ492_07725 [Mesorhizobium sp. B2-5-4]|uniref:hypothetical protein n=1 Tax=Mesorhizobium sp. B2-5-4 TaxID=2589926 RepID=UPI00112DDE29|nr:hypothetical protein [Mesorhizobium sp. B2-5-4]TPK45973.1 hypothetical protein FJ492_07725 [Mesorhizobium sp. B2-5-4]